MFNRRKPDCQRLAAFSANSTPLVVRQISWMPGSAFKEVKKRLHPQPDQGFASGHPDFGHSCLHPQAGQAQQLFIAQDVGVLQFNHVLHRRTIKAAQVAAVGNGKA